MKKTVAVLREIAVKFYHLVAFGIFFLFEAYAISSVFLAGDDFYYANFLRNGFDYFVSENVSHYLTVNGRALVHLLDEIFLALPLTFWKLFELFAVSAITWLIAVFAAGDARDEKRFPPALVMSCILVSMIHINIARETLYWITGSFNYVLPVLLVMILYRLLDKKAESGAWYLPLVAFLAAVTTEQSATVSVLLCLFMLAKKAIVEKRRLSLSQYLTVPASLVAFACLFLAPGNNARKALYADFYAKPLTERLSENLTNYFRASAESSGMLFFFLALFLVAMFSSIVEIKKADSGKDKDNLRALLYNVIVFMLAFITSVTMVLYSSSFFPTVYIRTSLCLFLTVITAGLIILRFAYRFVKFGDCAAELFFAVAAVVTYGAMPFGPVVGPRVFLAPIIFMAVPTVSLAFGAFRAKTAKCLLPFGVTIFAGYLFTASPLAVLVAAYFVLLLELVSPAVRKLHISSVLAFVGAIAVVFAAGKGFAANVQVHRFNESAILAYVENDNPPEILKLSQPLSALHAYSPPYSSKYHELRYMEFYGLDPETDIVYYRPSHFGIE